MKPKTELSILVAVGSICTLTFLLTNIGLHAVVRGVVAEQESIINGSGLGKNEPINGSSEQPLTALNVSLCQENRTDDDDGTLVLVEGIASSCLPNATGTKSQNEIEMELASQTLFLLWTVNGLALLMAVPPWITVLKFVKELDPSWIGQKGVLPIRVMVRFVLFHYPLVVLMTGVTWTAIYGPSSMELPYYLMFFTVVSFAFAYFVTVSTLKLTKDIAEAVGIDDILKNSLGGETWECFWDNILISKVRNYFLQIYNEYEAGGRKMPQWKDM